MTRLSKAAVDVEFSRIETLERAFQQATEEIAALKQRVAQLEATRRDDADGDLRRVIASSTFGLPFRASKLFAHRTVDLDLQKALEDVGLQTVAEVGCWLRNSAGVCDGIRIVRLRGRFWRAYTCDTCVHGRY